MDYREYMAGQTKKHFWYRGKNGLVNMILSKFCGKKREEKFKILNIGAGTGDDLEILAKYGDVYVTDVDQASLNLIDGKWCAEKRVADACELPYEDAFFDVAVSFDVFEHISDDFKAVSEIRRTLKSDGKLIFTVPAFQFLYSSHDKALDHKRRYSMEMMMELTREFRHRRLYYWNSVLFLPLALMRLIRRNAKPKVDSAVPIEPANTLFYLLLNMENLLLKYGTSFPFGVTIAGYCEK